MHTVVLTSNLCRLYFKQGLWFIFSHLLNCNINHAANCASCIMWNLQMQQTLPMLVTLLFILRKNKKKYSKVVSLCGMGNLFCFHQVGPTFFIFHCEQSILLVERVWSIYLLRNNPWDSVSSLLDRPFFALEVPVIKSNTAVSVWVLWALF